MGPTLRRRGTGKINAGIPPRDPPPHPLNEPHTPPSESTSAPDPFVTPIRESKGKNPAPPPLGSPLTPTPGPSGHTAEDAVTAETHQTSAAAQTFAGGTESPPPNLHLFSHKVFELPEVESGTTLGKLNRDRVRILSKEYVEKWNRYFAENPLTTYSGGVSLTKEQKKGARKIMFDPATLIESRHLSRVDGWIPGTVDRRNQAISIAEESFGRKIRWLKDLKDEKVSDHIPLLFSYYRLAVQPFIDLGKRLLASPRETKNADGETLLFLNIENYQKLQGELQIMQMYLLDQEIIENAHEAPIPIWGKNSLPSEGLDPLDFEIAACAYVEELEQFLHFAVHFAEANLEFDREPIFTFHDEEGNPILPLRDPLKKSSTVRSHSPAPEPESISQALENNPRLDEWAASGVRYQEKYEQQPAVPRNKGDGVAFRQNQGAMKPASRSALPASHPIRANQAPAFQSLVNPPASGTQATVARPLIATGGGGHPGDDDSEDDEDGLPPNRPPINPRTPRNPGSSNGHRPNNGPPGGGDGGGGGSGGGGGGGPPDDEDAALVYPEGRHDPSRINIVPHFDPKMKTDSVPRWDGNMDKYLKWVKKLNSLAAESPIINIQLGNIVPKRLTGPAEEWYYSQSVEHRENIEQSWPRLLRAINEFHLTKTFLDKYRVKARDAHYRDKENRHETPVEFIIRKMNMLELCFTISSPSEMIREVQSGMPNYWLTVLRLDMCETLAEFQNHVKYYEETLMDMDKSRRPEYSSRGRLAEAGYDSDREEHRIETYAAQPRPGPAKRPPSTPNRPPRLSMTPAQAINKRIPPSKLGARPCNKCNGPAETRDHWEPECPLNRNKSASEKVVRARLALAEAEEEEYGDLYNQASQSPESPENDEEDTQEDLTLGF